MTMKPRALPALRLVGRFFADGIGTCALCAVLLALLAWEFAVALWRTAILGQGEAEQLDDLR
jgi:hypothetical protein